VIKLTFTTESKILITALVFALGYNINVAIWQNWKTPYCYVVALTVPIFGVILLKLLKSLFK